MPGIQSLSFLFNTFKLLITVSRDWVYMSYNDRSLVMRFSECLSFCTFQDTLLFL
jgi:hypothetical protein